MNNPAVMLFLATLWAKFKQKNPIAATIVFLLCTSIVALSVISPDYGLGLPKWFSAFVIIATTILNGINGTPTTKFLQK